LIQVNIGSMELKTNHNVTQEVTVCTDFEKRGKLIKHLDQISQENAKVLIFVGTKRVADDLTKFLRQDGWPALAIHGDKQQQERDWVLAEFKSGRSPIMLATDVASRGLGECRFPSFPFPPPFVVDVELVSRTRGTGCDKDVLRRVTRCSTKRSLAAFETSRGGSLDYINLFGTWVSETLHAHNFERSTRNDL
jgi:hypothetical protein